MVGTNEPIRRHRPRTVRSETFRRKALNLLNGISIGLRSGEYCGRYCTVAPKASITSFTPGTLWAGRLSITTMSWHLNIGRQAVLPIGDESSLDRSVDNHRGHHLLCRNAATNVIVFHALRNMVDQSLATRATSPETDHIGAGQRH